MMSQILALMEIIILVDCQSFIAGNHTYVG